MTKTRVTQALLTLVLLAFASGCATVRAREQEDPGHGGFSFVLKTVSTTVQTACAPPEFIVRAVAAKASSQITQR